MKFGSFVEGLSISYHDMIGEINFICDSYITIKVQNQKEHLNCPIILIYHENWKDILPINGNRQEYIK